MTNSNFSVDLLKYCVSVNIYLNPSQISYVTLCIHQSSIVGVGHCLAVSVFTG